MDWRGTVVGRIERLTLISLIKVMGSRELSFSMIVAIRTYSIEDRAPCVVAGRWPLRRWEKGKSCSPDGS
jgi:hypothetical protein